MKFGLSVSSSTFTIPAVVGISSKERSLRVVTHQSHACADANKNVTLNLIDGGAFTLCDVVRGLELY